MESPFDSYVKRKNDGCSEDLLMDNVMIRISTFANYPSNSISTFRLAREGFYVVSGTSDTLACFECKAKGAGFMTDADNVNGIHNTTCSFKKILPNQPVVEPLDPMERRIAGAAAAIALQQVRPPEDLTMPQPKESTPPSHTELTLPKPKESRSPPVDDLTARPPRTSKRSPPEELPLPSHEELMLQPPKIPSPTKAPAATFVLFTPYTQSTPAIFRPTFDKTLDVIEDPPSPAPTDVLPPPIDKTLDIIEAPLSPMPTDVLPPLIDRTLDYIGPDPEIVSESSVPTPEQRSPDVLKYADIQYEVAKLMAGYKREMWSTEPIHNGMVNEPDRLKSFSMWRCVTGTTPTTHSLANSGFFYIGDNDSTSCHHCDLKLKNWEPKDNPWIEHARWQPRCDFLLKAVGSRYIATVQAAAKTDSHMSCSKISQILKEARVGNNVATDLANHPAVIDHISKGYDSNRIAITHKMIIADASFKHVTMNDVANAILDNTFTQARVGSQQNGITKDELRLVKESKLADLEKLLNDNSNDSLSDVQKQYIELKRRIICKICKKEDACLVFLPCAHLSACSPCYSKMKGRKCPLCNATHRSTVKAFLT
ncbi:uncharacterized protein LOC125662965 [Ostrea edulis]|uniref:uncharacterized protein LOC125662965 n=1 Tax=Ostrea edulis TaxID=37623 RepID=UPI0024AF72AA|nr:uncharacterized protein LOC125662965 [Ostrea edulis]